MLNDKSLPESETAAQQETGEGCPGSTCSAWIAFSDQLPARRKRVLATDGESYPSVGYLEKDSDKFYDMEYGWVNVTHWMDIRQPDGSDLGTMDDDS
jgi:hypothetical protein